MFATGISQYSSQQHSVIQSKNQLTTENSQQRVEPGNYAPSERALLLTAIAQEVNVTELTESSANLLREALHNFGLTNSFEETLLLDQICLKAKSEITVNSLLFLHQINQISQPYQTEKAIGHLQTTLQNLACARNQIYSN